MHPQGGEALVDLQVLRGAPAGEVGELPGEKGRRTVSLDGLPQGPALVGLGYLAAGAEGVESVVAVRGPGALGIHPGVGPELRGGGGGLLD